MTKQVDALSDLQSLIGPIHKHPLYNVWNNMRKRCHNPKTPQFKDYGLRGITVCDDWRFSSVSFIKWAINSGYSAGLEIDRKNNNGPYSPDNCRWVTRKRNKRNCRNTLRGPDGVPLADHAERLGISRVGLTVRLRCGMAFSDAISRPRYGRASAPVLKGGDV